MQRQSILLVEDEDALREELEEFLSARGFDLHCAVDATAALALLEQGLVPDAIVTDLYLGVENGMALVHAARANPMLADCRVIVISGHARAEEAEALLDERTRFLAKPVDLGQLLILLEG